MQYTFSYTNPHSHIIDIELQVENIEADQLELHLPSWRPGRYTIQNFAKNIISINIKGESGNALPFAKVNKDTWAVETQATNSLRVSYSFYAFQMDAGNSWLDDEQLYLNFINCALYAEGRLDEECTISLKVPSDYKFATGLKKIGKKKFIAPNYYQLVDSPLVACKNLRKIQYSSFGHSFFLWIIGEHPLNDETIIADFQRFTDLQIEVMGEFPSEDYHFIYQCLPYKHYHGVEHWNSTVITIGPSKDLGSRPLYKEFLGVSSHELFHTWNVIRLRPEEMTPYDFKRENYHKTGFITEGVTTYYGDLFLSRCGIFSQDEYIGELNKMLERHYLNEGRRNMSVAASSYDLWLDGYEKGVPGRKVSIYNEGALLALILDLKIRLKWNNEISLDDVMRLMWEKHGRDQSGYSYTDYQEMCEEVYGASLSNYFENYVSGISPFEEELEKLLPAFGLGFFRKMSEKVHEAYYGFKLIENDGRHFIDGIAPGSPAEELLSIKDEILNFDPDSFNGSNKVALTLNRFGRSVALTIHKGKGDYFSVYQVAISGENKEHLQNWIGKEQHSLNH